MGSEVAPGDVALAEKKIRFDLIAEDDAASSPGGSTMASEKHHTYDQLVSLSSADSTRGDPGENKATVVSAKYANEFDAKTQRRCLAFYRRLDRGLGLVLHYVKGATSKHLTNLGVSYGSRLEVILYAQRHEVCWASHEMGAKRRFDMRKIPKKFPLDELLLTDALADDPTKTRFRVTLGAEAADKRDTVELVFSAETEHARSVAIRGFELLRKHHMQIIPPDGDLAGIDALGGDVSPGAGSLSYARGSESRGGGSFARASADFSLAAGGAKGGSVAALIADSYDPKRAPVHRRFRQEVRAAEAGYKATVVEVHYEAFFFHTAQITLPDGNVFHLPHDNFIEGMWVTGAVRGFDADRNEYDVEYLEGPFEHDPETGADVVLSKFPKGTMFNRVHRADMHIDMSMQQTSGFPLFMVAITLAQVGVFVAWSDYVRRGSLGGPVSLAVNMVGDWPKCGDQRGQLWRYVGYQFVHADASHIIYNAIVQLTLGIPVELVHGSPRICGIYLVSVVVGALAVVFATPQYIIVGASGGVYSLFGVHLGNVLLNFEEYRAGLCNRWMRILALGLFVFGDLVQYYEAREAGGRASTSYAAHLGGFAAGFVFALIFLHEMVDHPMEHCIRRLAWVVAAASVAFLVGWNVVNDPPKGLPAFYTDRENLPCCFQALYCDGLDQADWRDWKESFVCTSSGNKHVLWDGLGADAPDDTFSCSMLEDVLDA